MKTTVYFIRHGTTDNNVGVRLLGKLQRKLQCGDFFGVGVGASGKVAVGQGLFLYDV